MRDGLRAVKNTIEDRCGSLIRASACPALPRVCVRACACLRVRACVRACASERACVWMAWLCRCVLPGAGAFEIAAARMLKEHTKAMTGRAKMVREHPSCWLP